MKPSPKRTVKAWAVLEEGNLTCFASETGSFDSYQRFWQYPLFLSKREALAWKKVKHAGDSVVPVTLAYSLPTPRKKK